MGLLGLNSKATVEALPDGRIAIWGGDGAEPSGVVLWPAAALETAMDMLRLTFPGELDPVQGVIERIAVQPPADEGLTSRLTFTISGQPFSVLIGWADLSSLARIASSALNAAATEGSA